jgi:hypothetical protein
LQELIVLSCPTIGYGNMERLGISGMHNLSNLIYQGAKCPQRRGVATLRAGDY